MAAFPQRPPLYKGHFQFVPVDKKSIPWLLFERLYNDHLFIPGATFSCPYIRWPLWRDSTVLGTLPNAQGLFLF